MISRRHQHKWIMGVGVVLVLLAGCGRKPETSSKNRAEPSIGRFPSKEATQRRQAKMQEFDRRLALQGAPPAPEVELLDVGRVEKLLPERLAGMRRESVSAQRQRLSHFSVAEVNALYEHGSGRAMRVSMSDLAGMASVPGLPAYPWLAWDLDRDTEFGHEKTMRVAGHKAYERYNAKERLGFAQLLIKNRVIIEIEAEGVDDSDVTMALQSLPVASIAGMVDALPAETVSLATRNAPPLAPPGG